MQQKMLKLAGESPIEIAPFDLSTPPLVSEVAVNLFAEFILKPESLDSLIIRADKEIQSAFEEYRENYFIDE